jgi:hypothetical protein
LVPAKTWAPITSDDTTPEMTNKERTDAIS